MANSPADRGWPEDFFVKKGTLPWGCLKGGAIAQIDACSWDDIRSCTPVQSGHLVNLVEIPMYRGVHSYLGRKFSGSTWRRAGTGAGPGGCSSGQGS